MGRLSWRDSRSVQSIESAVHAIRSVAAAGELQHAAALRVVTDAQRSTATLLGVDRIRQLHREQFGAPLGVEESQQFCLHSRRPIHDRRRCLSYMFDDGQYEPAAEIVSRE